MDSLRTVAPGAESDRATGRRSENRSLGAKAFRQLSLAVAIYGMVEWIYVAICSLVVPDTLDTTSHARPAVVARGHLWCYRLCPFIPRLYLIQDDSARLITGCLQPRDSEFLRPNGPWFLHGHE